MNNLIIKKIINMQDINKKKKKTFQLTEKNTFSLKNCISVKKTDKNFSLAGFKR